MQKNNCEKCEEWPVGFVIIVCSLLSITILWGLHISYTYSLIAALGFMALSIANLFAAFYTTCRHCYYYGKRCYLALGLLVPFFFQKTTEPINIYKEGAWGIIFFLNILYPVVLLFKMNSFWGFIWQAIAYLTFPLIGLFLVHRYSCPKCRNVGCIMNPDRG